MTVPEDSSPKAKSANGNKGTIGSVDDTTTKIKVKKHKKTSRETNTDTDSVTSSKSRKNSTVTSVENDPETPTLKKKSKRISVARTQSGSATAELPPKSPLKRAKSSSASAVSGKKKLQQPLIKPSSFKIEKYCDDEANLPAKPQSMTNLGDRKQAARRRSSRSKSDSTSENITSRVVAVAADDVPLSSVARMPSFDDDSTNRSGISKARSQVQDKMAAQESVDASCKKTGKAVASASTPNKVRTSIRQQIRSQEGKFTAKATNFTRSSNDAASPTKDPLPPTEPGAYRMQGSDTVARPSTGALSPHNVATTTPPSSPTRPRQMVVSNKGSPIPRALLPEQAPSPFLATTSLESETPIPKSAQKKLVVAAKLSDDVETHIEEEVRRRIMAEAAKAQVVSVSHGIPMLDPKEEARRMADLRELHKPRGVRERLFGDSRKNIDVDIAASPESIRKRNYLKWTVRRNQATSLWVATVQTKQEAVEQHDVIEVERTSVSFSAPTQQEAFETGLANAVPMIQPTHEHPICYVCKAKFALFRRPQQCKNCGVCMCSSCTIQWPGKMFPDTYGAKTLNNVCTACDWLANSFRDALVDGNYRSALHLYATGNVNIRTPFCLDKRAEAM